MAYYRGGGDSTRPHSNSILNHEQKNLIVSILIAFSNVHHGLTPAQARNEVLKVIGVRMSRNTLWNFIKRNNDRFTMKKTKLLSFRRTDPKVLEYVGTFCAQVLEM